MINGQNLQCVLNPLNTKDQLRFLNEKLQEAGFEYYVYIQNLPFLFSDAEPRFLCISNLPHSNLKNLKNGIPLSNNPLVSIKSPANKQAGTFSWHSNNLSNPPDLTRLFKDFPQLYGLNLPHRNTSGSEHSSLLLLRTCQPVSTHEMQHQLSDLKLLIISARYLLRQHLVNHYQKTRYPTLSSRQLQVSRCIASGMTNNDIADLLQITNDTVKYHISQILSKTNSSSRTAGAFKALLPELIN